MHCAERFLLQAPGEVLCAHRPAQPESHFAERETEALRLGDAFEATPQKDGKAEFLTQDSRTPRPTPFWGHSTTIQSFHHRPCARLPTGVVSICVGNHAAQRCIRDHQGSAASGNPTASEPIPGYHPLWDFIRFPLPWAALCQLSNPLVVSQL